MDLTYAINLLGWTIGSLCLGKIFLGHRPLWHTVFYYGFITGFLFYSGAVIASGLMPGQYVFSYVVFLISFCLSFRLWLAILGRAIRPLRRGLAAGVAHVENFKVWTWIVVVVLFLQLFPLLYPTFRLNLLISPPVPDLTSAFGLRFEQSSIDSLSKIVEYATLLLTPFYYIALYRFRNRISLVLFLLLFPFYVQYVNAGYKSRGELLTVIGIAALGTWHLRPELRKRLVFAALILTPSLLVGFSVFERVRLGGEWALEEVGWLESIGQILTVETELPLHFGLPLLESGVRANLQSYLTWIVTLPFPKILFGDIAGARVTYEISEAILNVDRGNAGFYVVLPGLLSEAHYLYGPYLFWIHGICIGAVIAFFARLFDEIPQLIFLNALLAMLMMYSLNRSGIASFLPVVVNQFLLFYLFVFIYSRLTRRRRPQELSFRI